MEDFETFFFFSGTELSKSADLASVIKQVADSKENNFSSVVATSRKHLLKNITASVVNLDKKMPDDKIGEEIVETRPEQSDESQHEFSEVEKKELTSQIAVKEEEMDKDKWQDIKQLTETVQKHSKGNLVTDKEAYSKEKEISERDTQGFSKEETNPDKEKKKYSKDEEIPEQDKEVHSEEQKNPEKEKKESERDKQSSLKEKDKKRHTKNRERSERDKREHSDKERSKQYSKTGMLYYISLVTIGTVRFRKREDLKGS